MIKKIFIFGIDTKKGLSTFDFFINHSNKYNVCGVSFVKKEIDLDLLNTLEKQSIKEILVKTNSQKQTIDENVSHNVKVYIKASSLLKESLSDIVVFSESDIDCVPYILSAISEYKDLCFVDWLPLLYVGNIIFKEIRNKGVMFYSISRTICSVDQILSDNKQHLVKNIGLVSTKIKDSRLKTSNQSNYEDFRKTFLSKNLISVSYNMFLLSYIYNIPLTKFCFYEQNKPTINVIVNFLDGCNVLNYGSRDIISIYNHYFLTKQDFKEKGETKEQNITNLSLEKIDLKKQKFLELATKALDKKGSAPVLYFLSIEYLIKKIYEKKVTITKSQNILEEIINNKKLYSQYPDLKTLVALKNKIQKIIDKSIVS